MKNEIFSFSPIDLNKMLRRSTSSVPSVKAFDLSDSSNLYFLTLSPFIPVSVHSFLSFLSGISFDLIFPLPSNEENDKKSFRLELFGYSPGTIKYNQKHRTNLIDSIVIFGSFKENYLHSDYVIFTPSTSYNLHFINGIRSGEGENIFLHQKNENGVVILDLPDSTVLHTYHQQKLIRTQIEDTKNNVRTTLEIKDKKAFTVVRSTYDTRLMLSLVDTFGINPNVSVFPAPSVSDNSDNFKFREIFRLQQPSEMASRLTTKDSYLLYQLFRENAGDYTLVCMYTKEGVIGSAFITDQIQNDNMANASVLNRFLSSLLMNEKNVEFLIEDGIVSEKITNLLESYNQTQEIFPFLEKEKVMKLSSGSEFIFA